MSQRRPRPRQRHHTGPGMVLNRPVPGFYKRRLCSKGPWVPALIYESPARDPETGQAMDRAPALLCIVDGREACPYEQWTNLHPVQREEYERLCRERADVPEGADMMNTAPRI